METHIEIKIRLSSAPPGGLHEILSTFCEQSEG